MNCRRLSEAISLAIASKPAALVDIGAARNVVALLSRERKKKGKERTRGEGAE